MAMRPTLTKYKITCKCGSEYAFEDWSDSLDLDPFIDISCKCGVYYKKLSRENEYMG